MQLCNEGRPFENQKLKWHVFVSIDASKKSELWYTVCCMLPCRSKTAGGTVLAEGHCAPRWIIAASFGGRVFLDGIRWQIIRRTIKKTAESLQTAPRPRGATRLICSLSREQLHVVCSPLIKLPTTTDKRRVFVKESVSRISRSFAGT